MNKWIFKKIKIKMTYVHIFYTNLKFMCFFNLNKRINCVNVYELLSKSNSTNSTLESLNRFSMAFDTYLKSYILHFQREGGTMGCLSFPTVL